MFSKNKKKDSNTYYLNSKTSNEACFYNINTDKNLSKICFDKNIYIKESHIYLQLLKKQETNSPMISTLMSTKSFNDIYEIIYITHDLISLRQYLLQHQTKMILILNEVYSFVSIFNKYDFIHGNLHIDNIFLSPKDYIYLEFSIIDLSSSSFSNKDSSLSLNYWDYYTLYLSLKIFIENNVKEATSHKYIEYIINIIKNYIGSEKKFNHVFTYYKQLYQTHHNLSI